MQESFNKSNNGRNFLSLVRTILLIQETVELRHAYLSLAVWAMSGRRSAVVAETFRRHPELTYRFYGHCCKYLWTVSMKMCNPHVSRLLVLWAVGFKSEAPPPTT